MILIYTYIIFRQSKNNKYIHIFQYAGLKKRGKLFFLKKIYAVESFFHFMCFHFFPTTHIHLGSASDAIQQITKTTDLHQRVN